MPSFSRTLLLLPLVALLAVGCPPQKVEEARIAGLSRGSFDRSLRGFQRDLNPEEWRHLGQVLMFLHLDDPLAVADLPTSLDDLMEVDFSSDLRIQLHELTAGDLTRFARGRFLGLVRQYQNTLADLDAQIAERADELAAARDSQAILTSLVIPPEALRLELVPGVSVVRANIRFENQTGRALSAALLRLRVRLAAGAVTEEEMSVTFSPVLGIGEARDLDRILPQSAVPDQLDASTLSFEVVNAYDQRQSPLAIVLDRGATEAVARLRTERAELEALLAQLGHPDDHPFLRLRRLTDAPAP